MVKKALILLILWTVGSLTISGCTKRKAENIKEGIIVLRYANGAHVNYDKFREAEARKFEKLHPDLMVKYEPIEGGAGSSYWTKIMTMIAGGTVQDVFRNDDAITLAKKGVILDLTPYMEKDKKYFDQIYPQLIEFHRYRGKIYGLPSNLNVDVLYYNKKLFVEGGLLLPDKSWTWDTMLESAKRLTKRNTRGITIQFGLMYSYLLELFKQNGGEIWSEDKTKCVINSPQNIRTLCFYKELTGKYHVSPNRSEMRDQGSWDIFIAGRLGIICGGRWLTALFNLKKDLDWGIAPLPKNKNRSSWASFNTLSVSSTTKHPELAYELVKFLTKPEAIKFLVDVGDSIPIRWTSEENEYFLNAPDRPENENQVYLDAMKYAYTNKWSMNLDIPYEIQNVILIQETERFLFTEEITGEKTLQNIQDKLNAILEEEKVE